MSTILKNFTPQQNYDLMKNKVIADDVGLTNQSYVGLTIQTWGQERNSSRT